MADALQITADFPTLNFPKEVDYPAKEDWAAWTVAAETNYALLSGSWSLAAQQFKDEANLLARQLNDNAITVQGISEYQGEWTSKGYILGQGVSVGDVFYICRLTHTTGQNPTEIDSSYWVKSVGQYIDTQLDLKMNKDINSLTNKTIPADADEFVIADSTSSFSLKKLSFSNLKATLLTYFDTLYSRTSAVFGIGQTWQNVTASRSTGVVYTNNTGKPIEVSIVNVGPSAGVTTSVSLLVDDEIVSSFVISNISAGVTVSGIVHNGSTYKCVTSHSISIWKESR